MKVSSTTTRATIVRNFVITEDSPVIPMAHASLPKEVRVETGRIKYIWEDGGWIVQDGWAIDLVGPVLKKDGTRSKNTHSRRPEEYRWLEAIVELLRPSDDLSMTVLNEHEI